MKCSQFLKLLKKNGWYEERQTGSHIKLVHNEIEAVIFFPFHGSAELPKRLEQKFRKIAGL